MGYQKNSIVYARHCEREGNLNEAIRVYAENPNPTHVVHAAKLAIRKNRYSLARTLIKKAEGIALDSYRSSQNLFFGFYMDPWAKLFEKEYRYQKLLFIRDAISKLEAGLGRK